MRSPVSKSSDVSVPASQWFTASIIDNGSLTALIIYRQHLMIQCLHQWFSVSIIWFAASINGSLSASMIYCQPHLIHCQHHMWSPIVERTDWLWSQKVEKTAWLWSQNVDGSLAVKPEGWRQLGCETRRLKIVGVKLESLRQVGCEGRRLKTTWRKTSPKGKAAMMV